MKSKSEIRTSLLQQRLDLPENKHIEYSQTIIQTLLPYLENVTYGLYVPVKNEVNTRSLKANYFPRCEGRLCKYYPSEWETLVKGKYGILEPIPTEATQPEVILVPGIAFTPQGYRIGFGHGYFDRTLKEQLGFKIGLAFDFQIIDEFEIQPWDVPVDLVITN